jgi:uncharacterized FlaG/YvyC family protein
MDVRIDGGYYQTPATDNGEFAPASAESPAPPSVAPTDARTERNDYRAERAERTEARDTLRRAVDEINSSIAVYRRHLGIRHHEPTNRRIVTVYDSDTNEVLREIPPESVLEAHANMLEIVGLFVNTRG